jgi:NAD(P)-dependent dehydrogenase (short-subunit alcohol dehydrogenase family)
MEISLAARTAIVTGGSSGIGSAAASALARAGAFVIILDRNVEAGESTAGTIREQGGAAAFIATDVTDEDSVRRAFATVVDEHGQIDVVHANAGITWIKGLLETSLDEWNHVIATNLTGAYLVCRAAMQHMVGQSDGGSIVVTASTRAFITSPDNAAYTASKGGVMALTRSLAIEGAPHGIRANAVLPGAIRTPMLEEEARLSARPAEEQLSRWALIHPLGRLGEAEDIAHAVVFLASDAASFITGVALPVDGGLMAAEPGGPPVAYSD